MVAGALLTALAALMLLTALYFAFDDRIAPYSLGDKFLAGCFVGSLPTAFIGLWMFIYGLTNRSVR